MITKTAVIVKTTMIAISTWLTATTSFLKLFGCKMSNLSTEKTDRNRLLSVATLVQYKSLQPILSISVLISVLVVRWLQLQSKQYLYDIGYIGLNIPDTDQCNRRVIISKKFHFRKLHNRMN